MATTTGYLDLGAVQRIESGSPTAKTGYIDLGAGQRQEAAGVSREPASVDLALSLTAPSVVRSDNRDIAPARVDLAISTTAPSVVQTANADLSPARVDLVISATAPSVAQTANVALSPAAVDLVVSPTAPTSAQDIRRDPARVDIAISAAAPTREVDDPTFPAAGDLTLTQTAPTAVTTANHFGDPPRVDLSISATAPTVSASGGVSVSPAAVDLALSTTAPTALVHQYMYPDADVSDGSWTDQDGGTSLFAAVDEDPKNSADYIKSSANPSADICRLRISNPGAQPAQPFDVQYAYLKQGASQIDLTVRLFQGVTEIAEWVHTDIADSELEATQTLTSPQFAAITDFNDLEIEFEAEAA